jgi:fibronectin type 3 domain-containing protein
MIQLSGCNHAPSVKLAWDPNPESYVAGYNVYRSEQSAVFKSPPINGATLVMRTSFTDSTVQPNRIYYYVVTAVSTDGRESAYSNQVQIITGPGTATKRAPLIVVKRSAGRR